VDPGTLAVVGARQLSLGVEEEFLVVDAGTGPARQRRALSRTGRWEDVVDYAVAQTG
jgi:hypothetical protein